MKIAVLTSGILPVPAVQGGAVENLIDFYLEYNEQHHLHDINVISIWHPDVRNHSKKESKDNHYQYIKQNGLLAKINKFIYQKRHQNEFYHYTIEYYFEQAYKKIKEEVYDLIIVENRPGFVLKLKERTKTPCILHLHNDFLYPETYRAKEMYNAYHRIICVSDYITNRVQGISPSSIGKCKTIYNAIDLKRVEYSIPVKRESIGLCDKDFIIIFSGRLTEEKGILQLIQAIKQTQDIPNIKLVIIGASTYGKDYNPTSYIKQLMAESEPIKNHVVFTGFVNYDQVLSYLKMADIAVVPSMWEEPFGLTVVEALAAGLPLIATNSGGIPEICNGVATIINRENIVSNITNAILDLYEHPEKRRVMSEAALKRSKLFSKERYAREFFEALETTTYIF